MKKLMMLILAIFLIFLIGCKPAEQRTPAQTVPDEQQTTSSASTEENAEPVVKPVQEVSAEEIPPAPLENIPAGEKEGVDVEKACYELLSAEEFSKMCEYSGKIELTNKVSEGSCWANIADPRNKKLTGGMTTVAWKTPEEAHAEFDRGVKARVKQGAIEGKVVGERSYGYDEVGRHNIVWQRGVFLTRLGAMNELCPVDKLVEVAQKIDVRLY